VLADIFAFERRPAVRDDAVTLYQSAEYLRSLLLRGIAQSPAANAKFADVANQMLAITETDRISGRITATQATNYRNFIRNRFTVREVVVSPTPLARGLGLVEALKVDVGPDVRLEAMPHIADGQPQNRRGCCGTMTLPENNGVDDQLEREKQTFLAELAALAQGPRPTKK
jgi:hypothetical protein